MAQVTKQDIKVIMDGFTKVVLSGMDEKLKNYPTKKDFSQLSTRVSTLSNNLSTFSDKVNTLPTKKDVRQIVNKEINSRNLATKDDLKQFATKEEVKELVMDITTQASDAILLGMEVMFKDIPKKSEIVLRKDFENLYA